MVFFAGIIQETKKLKCLICVFTNQIVRVGKDAGLSDSLGDMSGLTYIDAHLLAHIQHGTG